MGQIKISGVIRKKKSVIISLCDVLGIEPKKAEEICNHVKIDPKKMSSELTDIEINNIEQYINSNNLGEDVSQKKVLEKNKQIRISGINIRTNKRVIIALCDIFGIGPKIASDICNNLQIDKNKKANALTDTEVTNIQQYIDHHLEVEGELKKKLLERIRALMSSETYRGGRLKKGLPIKKNTKSNAKTSRKKHYLFGGSKK